MRHQHPTVLLFDIDGTLVTTGGVGRRALSRAFEELHRREDACNFPLDGMTDRAISRRALTQLNLPAGEKDIDAVLVRYLVLLEEEIARADIATYRVHEGMREALAAVRGQNHIAVGLGTGNVRDGARLKLRKVELFHLFDFGGFGCDHEDRVELIRCGAERGAHRLGTPLGRCRVVVIGDTPQDIAAAKGIGARCVGVGTGRYSAAELRAAGAEQAFDNLAVPGALAALLEET
jgi:phosphoglycolate phosphatase